MKYYPDQLLLLNTVKHTPTIRKVLKVFQGDDKTALVVCKYDEHGIREILVPEAGAWSEVVLCNENHLSDYGRNSEPYRSEYVIDTTSNRILRLQRSFRSFTEEILALEYQDIITAYHSLHFPSPELIPVKKIKG